MYPGLHDQKVEGGNSAPLLHLGETPPGVLHPAVGYKKDMDLSYEERMRVFPIMVVRHRHRLS